MTTTVFLSEMTYEQKREALMTMSDAEYREALDREDGRGHLSFYGKYLGMNPPIIDVLDYFTDEDGTRFARVQTQRTIGTRVATSEQTVPLEIMFATKKRRPLGFKPVPWC